MLKSVLALLLASATACASATAFAQTAPASAPAAPPARASLVERPPLDAVTTAFAISGLNAVDTWLDVDYDASGTPTKVTLGKSTGVEFLDNAIVSWGQRVKLRPGKAGSGRLPFKLTSD